MTAIVFTTGGVQTVENVKNVEDSEVGKKCYDASDPPVVVAQFLPGEAVAVLLV